jgi:hypothetical protein
MNNRNEHLYSDDRPSANRAVAGLCGVMTLTTRFARDDDALRRSEAQNVAVCSFTDGKYMWRHLECCASAIRVDDSVVVERFAIAVHQELEGIHCDQDGTSVSVHLAIFHEASLQCIEDVVFIDGVQEDHVVEVAYQTEGGHLFASARLRSRAETETKEQSSVRYLEGI